MISQRKNEKDQEKVKEDRNDIENPNSEPTPSKDEGLVHLQRPKDKTEVSAQRKQAL